MCEKFVEFVTVGFMMKSAVSPSEESACQTSPSIVMPLMSTTSFMKLHSL